MSLKAAGIPRKMAPTIGIAVDPRRVNISEESLNTNVARLKEYHSRLILFPRRNGRTKKADASAEETKAVKAGKTPTMTKTTDILPVENPIQISEEKLADHQGEENAYRKLRESRSEAKLVGVREKRAKLKAEQEQAAKK